MSQNCNIESLLVAIFQAAHCIEHDIGDPVRTREFLQYFAPDIARVGRVLKFLELAEKCSQSALGWKPTEKLIRIVVERAARPTTGTDNKATAKDRKLVDCLIQLAGGEPNDPLTDDFLFSVLNALGLLREARGGCKPTSLLREIVEGIFAT